MCFCCSSLMFLWWAHYYKFMLNLYSKCKLVKNLETGKFIGSSFFHPLAIWSLMNLLLSTDLIYEHNPVVLNIRFIYIMYNTIQHIFGAIKLLIQNIIASSLRCFLRFGTQQFKWTIKQAYNSNNIEEDFRIWTVK